jgi:hypothetical protein
MTDFNIEEWEYEIKGRDLSWRVEFPMPLGFTMVAHLGFSEVSYTPEVSGAGEAQGIPFVQIEPSEARAEGGEIKTVELKGHGEHQTITWPDSLKDAVIALVAAHVEETKIAEVEE